MNLQKILKFTQLLNDLQKVERTVYVTGVDRKENDVEHSYQLAMLAWYIAESQKLNLDKNLIIKYALVHDLVEAYAGDVSIYVKDHGLREKKRRLEKAAAKRIGKEYSEFPELHDLIRKYEEKQDPESKFVYALDKLQPVLNIHNDLGRTWKEQNVSWEMILETKKDKIALSPEVKIYFDEIMLILEEARDKFW